MDRLNFIALSSKLMAIEKSLTAMFLQRLLTAKKRQVGGAEEWSQCLKWKFLVSLKIWIKVVA
jgi:hypothetical protein